MTNLQLVCDTINSLGEHSLYAFIMWCLLQLVSTILSWVGGITMFVIVARCIKHMVTAYHEGCAKTNEIVHRRADS